MRLSADGGGQGHSRAYLPVVDNADTLLKLLYIRDVHGLTVADMPTTDPVPWHGGEYLQTRLAGEVRTRHEQAMSRLWRDSVHWLLGTSERHALTHEVVRSGDASRLHEVMPPKWDDDIGALLDLDGYARWYRSLPSSATAGVEEDDAATSAMSRAASRGLAVIIVLPLAETHEERVGDSGLMLSWGVYRRAADRRAALDRFRGRP